MSVRRPSGFAELNDKVTMDIQHDRKPVIRVDGIAYDSVYRLGDLNSWFGLKRAELEGAGIEIREALGHEWVLGREIIRYVLMDSVQVDVEPPF